MTKATERIQEDWYTVELVPEGTRQRRYIYNDGKYPIVDDTNGKVFEGGFYVFKGHGATFIVSPKWLRKNPDKAKHCLVKYFKLLD